MLETIEGLGEVDVEATAYTLAIYEQEFKGADLIADVLGTQRATRGAGGEGLVVDFATENWMAELRALWAMVKTANRLAEAEGRVAPVDVTPGFSQWIQRVGKVNMREVSSVVATYALDGFFHTGAAASDTTGQGEAEG